MTIEDTLKSLFQVVGGLLVAGGGLSLIVYQVFKHLSARWLDAKFEERFQNLKHAHDQEIEQLRFRISALLDRATKLHQREFEVLPEAWSKPNLAYWKTNELVAYVKESPDLNRMGAPQLNDFISKSRLTEWQREELRGSVNKTLKYEHLIFWHDLHDAKAKAGESARYLAVYGIFIEQAIKSDLDTLNQRIWEALIECESNKQYDMREDERVSILRSKGPTLVKALEVAIHKRLWPSDTVAAT